MYKPRNTAASGMVTVFTARRYAKRGICRRRVSVCKVTLFFRYFLFIMVQLRGK